MDKIITESKELRKTDAGERQVSEVTLSAAVISHRGCVRDNNEDNFFFEGDLMRDEDVNDGATVQATVTKDFHLLAVCDGMGGLMGGERASSIAIHAMSLLNQYFPHQAVGPAADSYLREAGDRVLKDSISLGEEGREGTTVVLLYISDGIAHIVNVGDSRAYLLRMGKLYQLSFDDSPVFRMMKRGELKREQARKHPQANRIEAYLGMPPERKPSPYGHHFQFPVCDGDRFMLCSDGLSDLLSHEEIQKWMVEEQQPLDTASRLIWRAMEMGGKDNTTCVVADASGTGLPPPNKAGAAEFPQD